MVAAFERKDDAAWYRLEHDGRAPEGKAWSLYDVKRYMKLSLLALALPFFVACSSGGPSPSPSSSSGSAGDASATSAMEPGETDGGGGGGAGDGGGGGPAKATGLEGFCEHYFECGGSYYADVKDCVDRSESHWGACRRPELDAFGDCMMNVECKDWNPDAYNPASTPCANEWKAVGAKQCP